MKGLSSGKSYRRSRLRAASAVASANGPTRPANMSRIRISCAATGSCPVMPVDRPTVANALVTSNRIWSEVNCGADQQGHRGAGDGTPRRDREGLPDDADAQPPTVGDHGAVSPHFGDDGGDEDGGGGDLHAAGGAAGTAAEEHEHVGAQQGRWVEVGVVGGVEPGGAGADAGEERVEQADRRGPQMPQRTVPFAQRHHRRAGGHEDRGADEREPGGQTPAPARASVEAGAKPAGGLQQDGEADAADHQGERQGQQHPRVGGEPDDVVGVEGEPGVVESGDRMEDALHAARPQP